MSSRYDRCCTLIILILLIRQLHNLFWLSSESTNEGTLPLSFGSNREEAYFSNIQEETTIYNETTYYASSGFCSLVPLGVSASFLWRQHQERIIQATALTASHIPWMRRLFHTLSPDVLEHGIVVWPELNVLKAVFTPLRNNETLRVAVMGGSVAEGRGCEVLPRAELKSYINKTDPKIDSRKCSWVYRLQMLADEYSLPIQVFNLATGGTNSFLALPVLEYQLYHSDILKQLGGPHVLFNAYASNDALYSWSWDTTINNATVNYDHYKVTWDAASKFVAAAASSCKQKSLVVFVNEYVGNYHDRLLGEDIRNDAVRKVAQDSGSMYISSAKTVRPWVYGNTRETLFTAPWWMRAPKRNAQGRRPFEYRRDPHFGMPGHIAVTWVVAYSLLRAAIEYCEQESNEKVSQIALSVDLNDFTTALPLSSPWNTTFREWLLRHTERPLQLQQHECSADGPCLFAFVANPAGTHRQRNKLASYISTFEVFNSGWQAEDDIRNGWQNKLGLSTHTTGAKLALEFKNISQTVSTISLHSLKSYGPAWDDTVAHFNISIRYSDPLKKIYQANFEIAGFHDQNTSLTYPFQVKLQENLATIGSYLRIEITLLRGSNFKITSLLLCDR